MNTVDIVTGFASEVDRKRSKAKLKNKGKSYDGRLWSWITYIIYGGYTLWRTGYAVSAAKGGDHGESDFTSRAIPSPDRYCTEKVCFRPYFDEHVTHECATVWRIVDRCYKVREL